MALSPSPNCLLSKLAALVNPVAILLIDEPIVPIVPDIADVAVDVAPLTEPVKADIPDATILVMFSTPYATV